MVDAVILAGGVIPEREADFRQAVGVGCKSLIPLNGRLMVRYVIEALKGARGINRVAVVGPKELQGHPDCAAADVVLKESAGRSENLFLALDAFPDADRILMLTSDIPLVTPEMIDDFIVHLPPEVDLAYVFVREETVLAKYADRPAPPVEEGGRQMPNWVTVALKEGKFTGTPCVAFSQGAAEKSRPFLKQIFDDRDMGNVINALKPLFGAAFLMKVGLAIKFPSLASLISITDVEEKLSKGLGLTCRGYVSPHAEMAFDVDHLTDVSIAERVLKARGAG